MQNGSQLSSSRAKIYNVFVGLSMLIALVVAVLSVIPQQAAQVYAAYATRFFVGLVPILSTAALVKYIVCSPTKKMKNCSVGSCEPTKEKAEELS